MRVRPPRRVRASLAVLAVLASLVAAGAAAWAGAGGTGGAAVAADPGLSLTDDSGGVPMFQVDGLRPGDTVERCATIRVGGPVDAAVRLRVDGPGDGLAPFLDVAVDAGRDGTFASCGAFKADGPVFRGTLTQLERDNSAGVPVFDATTAAREQSVRMRFTLSSAAPIGLSAPLDVVWTATGDEPVVPTPTPTPTPDLRPEPTVSAPATGVATATPAPKRTRPRAPASRPRGGSNAGKRPTTPATGGQGPVPAPTAGQAPSPAPPGEGTLPAMTRGRPPAFSSPASVGDGSSSSRGRGGRDGRDARNGRGVAGGPSADTGTGGGSGATGSGRRDADRTGRRPTTLRKVVDAVRPVAERAALPLFLLLAMFLFLLLQNLVDRRDPKLALSPLRREADLSFDDDMAPDPETPAHA